MPFQVGNPSATVFGLTPSSFEHDPTQGKINKHWVVSLEQSGKRGLAEHIKPEYISYIETRTLRYPQQKSTEQQKQTGEPTTKNHKGPGELVWMDPQKAVTEVREIAEQLKAVLPSRQNRPRPQLVAGHILLLYQHHTSQSGAAISL